MELALPSVKGINLTRLHCTCKYSTAEELSAADVQHNHLYWGSSDSCHKLSGHCQMTLSIPLLTFLHAKGTQQASSKVKGKFDKLLQTVCNSGFIKLTKPNFRSKSNAEKSKTLHQNNKESFMQVTNGLSKSW